VISFHNIPLAQCHVLAPLAAHRAAQQSYLALTT